MHSPVSVCLCVCAAAMACLAFMSLAEASDHLDTDAVIADPAADIGDLYAWTSSDGKRLNLVMTIVGGKFSDHVRYTFHVDSGRKPGATSTSVAISCIFNAPTAPQCRAGDADELRGEAGGEPGLRGGRGRFRVFAGLRDDPFFNNVRGTRAAYDVADAAMQAGVSRDAGGCPSFDRPTSEKIFREWRQTEGGPGRNLLAGWKTAALVVEVDLAVVNGGGPLLGVWASTVVRGVTPGHARELDDGVTIDRMGRALTGNALIGTFDTEEASNRRKLQYNQAGPAEWRSFVPDLTVNLANYDGFDGACGNQWLAAQNSPSAERYTSLARLLADDRLWVDSRSKVCRRYLAVELEQAGVRNADCGGRTPAYDAADVFRSLLVSGDPVSVDDGVPRDDRSHASAGFPFLSPP